MATELLPLPAEPLGPATQKAQREDLLPLPEKPIPLLPLPAKPLAPQEPGFVTGIAEGAVRQLTAPLQSQEELAKDKSSSLERTLGRLVGDVGSSIALATGAGAIGGAIGGPAGALLGTLGYAVWAGLGSEKIRSAEEGKEFSLPRAGVQTFIEAVPGLKASSKAQKILRAGAVTLASAGQEAIGYEGSLASTALAALGGLLGGASIRVADDTVLDPKIGRQIVEAAGDPTLANKAAIRFKEARKEVGDLESLSPEFKRFLVGQPKKGEVLEKAFLKKAKTLTRENLQEEHDLWLYSKALVKEAEEQAAEMAQDLGGDGTIFRPIHDFAMRNLGDPLVNARRIDKRTGLNVELDYLAVPRADNKFKFAALPFLKTAKTLNKAGTKAGIRNEKIGRVLAGVEEGTDLSAEQKDIVAGWRNLFDSLRETTRQAGYNVGYLDNFLPMTSKRGADLAFSVEKRVKDLQRAFGSKWYETAASEDVLDVLKRYTDVEEITDSLHVKQALDNLKKGITKTQETFDVSTAFERTGSLPDFSREFDVGKVFQQYASSSLRAAYLSRPMKKMLANVKALKALGLEDDAATLENYVSSLAGREGGLKAFADAVIEDVKLRSLRQMEKGGLSGTFGKATYGLADWAGFVNAQVYPAFLGLNVRAALRNYTQPWAVTAPELGHGYGHALAFRGAFKYNLENKKVMQRLERLGLLGSTTTEELGESFGLGSKYRDLAKKAGDAALAWYSSTDRVNRGLTASMAELLVDDFLKGVPRAKRAIEKMGPSFRSKMREIGQDREALVDLATDVLIGKTQFHYGKHSQSEVMRKLGPAFSQFTKWPTMIGSDIAETISSNPSLAKGVAEVTWKYGLPYALAMAADQAIQSSDERQIKRIKDYAIGDLTDLTPLQALGGLKDVGQGGPLLQGLTELFFTDIPQVISEPSRLPESAAKLGEGLVRTYTPVAAPLNELERIQKKLLGEE